jgi:ACR3 family arsenite efflux pump ArsB
MNFNFDVSQMIMAGFFLLTVAPMTAMALHGFSSWSETIDNDLDSLTQILVQIWVLMILPVSFYIAIFTKFNNPFKEVKT